MSLYEPEMDDAEFHEYEVTCARCGVAGSTADFFLEEGDEWECPRCWAQCEAEESSSLGKPHE